MGVGQYHSLVADGRAVGAVGSRAHEWHVRPCATVFDPVSSEFSCVFPVLRERYSFATDVSTTSHSADCGTLVLLPLVRDRVVEPAAAAGVPTAPLALDVPPVLGPVPLLVTTVAAS